MCGHSKHVNLQLGWGLKYPDKLVGKSCASCGFHIVACYEVVPQTGDSQYLTRLLFPMWHLSFIVGTCDFNLSEAQLQASFSLCSVILCEQIESRLRSEAKSWCFDRPEGRDHRMTLRMRSNMAHPTDGKFHAGFFTWKACCAQRLRPTRAWSLCKALTTDQKSVV